MTRALFDSDVILDALTRREPFATISARAVDLSTRGRVEGYVSAHAVTTIAYVLRRALGTAARRPTLTRLMAHLRVADVTDSVVRQALASPMPDFEDAVAAAAADAAGLDVIVTRNVRDFALSTVPAILPETFLIQERSP